MMDIHFNVLQTLGSDPIDAHVHFEVVSTWFSDLYQPDIRVFIFRLKLVALWNFVNAIQHRVLAILRHSLLSYRISKLCSENSNSLSFEHSYITLRGVPHLQSRWSIVISWRLNKVVISFRLIPELEVENQSTDDEPYHEIYHTEVLDDDLHSAFKLFRAIGQALLAMLID